MKGLLLAAALSVMLAACDWAAEESDEPLAVSSTASATPTHSWVGNYEVTQKDGTKTSTMLMEDGTYMDMDGSGSETGDGTWRELVDGKLCFDPDGDEGPSCYTPGKVGPDGTFVAVPDEGEPVTVRKTG